MSNPDYEYEDLFVSDEEGWIHLPGEQGKVSPDGTVFSQDGEVLYTFVEDNFFDEEEWVLLD